MCSFLRFDHGFTNEEVGRLVSRFGVAPLAVLAALDDVQTYSALGALGLVHAYQTDRDLRRRFARVRNGRDARECFRRFLKHLSWAARYRVPRKALQGVSVVEWDIAEEGNPWIFCPVLSEFFGKRLRIEDAIAACAQFLTPAQSASLDTRTAQIYAWTLAYMQSRASRDRIFVETVRADFYKSSLSNFLDFCSVEALESFDPSLGHAPEHELFDAKLGTNTISLTESFAETSQRAHRVRTGTPEEQEQAQEQEQKQRKRPRRDRNKARPLRLAEAQSFRRLANHLMFVGVPSSKHPETSDECVVLREPLGSETQMVRLLDMVQSRALETRERAGADARLAEAAAQARPQHKRQRAWHAGGLSLESDSDSDSDDDDDEARGGGSTAAGRAE